MRIKGNGRENNAGLFNLRSQHRRPRFPKREDEGAL